MNYKFNLNEFVKLKDSGKSVVIIEQMEFDPESSNEPMYGVKDDEFNTFVYSESEFEHSGSELRFTRKEPLR